MDGTHEEKAVTKEEWLACTDLHAMLAFLKGNVSD
jgi:hypothetical protein